MRLMALETCTWFPKYWGNFPYTYTEDKKDGETKTQPGRHINACQTFMQTADDLVICLQKRNGVQYIAKTKTISIFP